MRSSLRSTEGEWNVCFILLIFSIKKKQKKTTEGKAAAEASSAPTTVRNAASGSNNKNGTARNRMYIGLENMPGPSYRPREVIQVFTLAT